jgi:DNA-binding phage protein
MADDKRSTRTKMLEEAKIEDDPLMIKRALRGAGVGISKLADKAGFTQEEEYKKMEDKKKKRAGGMTKMKSGGYVKSADGCAKRGKTRGMMV